MSEGYWITTQEHAKCEEERERLRAELAAAKELLREALGAIYTYSLNGVSLHARIRAALGDDPTS